MAVSSSSPTLLGLPVELRIQIYRNVFEGSCVIFKPRSRKDKFRGVRQGQSDAFTTNDQWAILLTCWKCYNEGRAIFWEETRLHGGDLEDLFCADFLATAVSKFTREHVQHLRCIFHQSLGHVLERFAVSNLKTIELHFQPLGSFSTQVWEKLDDYETFTQMILPRALRVNTSGHPDKDSRSRSRSIWQQWLDERKISLPRENSCTFLTQLHARTCLVGKPARAGIDPAQQADCNNHEHLVKLLFFNFNTGKLFVALESSIGSEEGFYEIIH